MPYGMFGRPNRLGRRLVRPHSCPRVLPLFHPLTLSAALCLALAGCFEAPTQSEPADGEGEGCLVPVYVNLNGATGTPGAGLNLFECGVPVSYSYTPAPGHDVLTVRSAGRTLPVEGAFLPVQTSYIDVRAVEVVPLTAVGQDVARASARVYQPGRAVEGFTDAGRLLHQLVDDLGLEEGVRHFRYAYALGEANVTDSVRAVARSALEGQVFTVGDESGGAGFAGEKPPPGAGEERPTRVIHVNGILTSEADAHVSAQVLYRQLTAQGRPSLLGAVEHVYNPTTNWDVLASFCKRVDEVETLDEFSRPYEDALAGFLSGVGDPLDLSSRSVSIMAGRCEAFLETAAVQDLGQSVELFLQETVTRLLEDRFTEFTGVEVPMPRRTADPTALTLDRAIKARLATSNVLLVPHSQGNLYALNALFSREGPGNPFSAHDHARIAVLSLASPLRFTPSQQDALGGFREYMVQGDVLRLVNPATPPSDTELSDELFEDVLGPYEAAFGQWRAEGCFDHPLTGSASCPPPGAYLLPGAALVALQGKRLHSFPDSYLSPRSPSSVEFIRSSVWEMIEALPRYQEWPGAPQLRYPDHLAEVDLPWNQGLLLMWDRIDGVTRYRFELANNPSFAGAESAVLSFHEQEQPRAGVGPPEGWWYWRVRVEQDGTIGPWSAIRSFYLNRP